MTAVTGHSPSTKLLTRSDFSDGFSAVSGLAAPKSSSRLLGKIVVTSVGFSTPVSSTVCESVSDMPGIAFRFGRQTIKYSRKTKIRT